MAFNEFANWLEDELRQRDWRQADLAAASNVDSGYISRMLSGDRTPGPETCVMIARGLNVPPEEVFRRAGFLPERRQYDVQEERALWIFSQLPEDLQRYLLTQMEALLDEEQRKRRPERRYEQG